MTCAAVISDLGGVLVDSSASLRRVWARWGERHGVDGAAIQRANEGRPSRALITEHVPPEIVDAETAWVLEAEIADRDGVVAYPGAAEILALPVVAVATSCEVPLALARFAAAGLASPDSPVTCDQVARGKPSPDSYLLAADRLAVDAAACVVLEDAPSGVAGGRGRHDRLGGHDDALA